MITGLSHVSIVVPSLEAAAKRLKGVYGLEVGAAKVNEEQGVRLAYVELANARIELMEPSRRTRRYRNSWKGIPPAASIIFASPWTMLRRPRGP